MVSYGENSCIKRNFKCWQELLVKSSIVTVTNHLKLLFPQGQLPKEFRNFVTRLRGCSSRVCTHEAQERKRGQRERERETVKEWEKIRPKFSFCAFSFYEPVFQRNGEKKRTRTRKICDFHDGMEISYEILRSIFFLELF